MTRGRARDLHVHPQLLDVLDARLVVGLPAHDDPVAVAGAEDVVARRQLQPHAATLGEGAFDRLASAAATATAALRCASASEPSIRTPIDPMSTCFM